MNMYKTMSQMDAIYYLPSVVMLQSANNGIQYKPAYKNLEIKNLLAEICFLNTPKYKNLFSQKKSKRFLYVGLNYFIYNTITVFYQKEYKNITFDLSHKNGRNNA